MLRYSTVDSQVSKLFVSKHVPATSLVSPWCVYDISSSVESWSHPTLITRRLKQRTNQGPVADLISRRLLFLCATSAW
ncbi:hypothetical protein PoB_002380500 [Plakobranchus ocellatus]|uniref:Uncharacterized protein n=1 Tax=Plakobranchus ocellatus TaxID=259542 RepID=A0AAV3ZRS4_9GAST|nr:hypothetical protein PoB_002380500 [Plakobranchus ocellatus]